jgi:peptide-methionine (S)-S-oxide reductase
MRKFIVCVLLSLFLSQAQADVAVFAGGCFWCTQTDLEKIEGVQSSQVGYDGGVVKDPTYYLVSSGTTNYVESVRVQYDSAVITYQRLVEQFLKTVDVSQGDGQFCDIGRQYRSVIFYLNAEQKEIANAAIEALSKKIPNVKTDVLPSTNFYVGEEYHQHYAKKNPIRYKYYRWRCGRDKRLEALWGEHHK